MHDKDQIRDAIIQVARSIFARFGFRKTTMDEIAAAGRKGKSSIYYYFASKEEIFQAVVEKEASLLRQAVLKAVNEAESPEQKLKMYVMVRMQNFEKLANFYSAIKDDYLSHLDFIEKVRKKYDEDEIKVIQKILSEGVSNNVFEIENTLLAAIALATALKGLEIPMFWGDAENDNESRIDHLIHILFNGIVKR